MKDIEVYVVEIYRNEQWEEFELPHRSFTDAKQRYNFVVEFLDLPVRIVRKITHSTVIIEDLKGRVDLYDSWFK